MTLSSERISHHSSIDHLRFIFAVLVVFIHAYGHGVLPGDVLAGECVAMEVQQFFSHILSAIAVPGFFLISGYLYFLKMQRWSWEQYVQKTRQRSITILMPFLVWNTLKLMTLLLPAWVHNGWEGVASVFDTYGGWRIFWDGNPHYPAPVLLATWFLRDLMVFCLMAPLIHLLVRYASFLPFVLLMVCDLFGWWPVQQVCSAHHLAFFVFGATCSIRGKALFGVLSEYRMASYLLGTLSLVVVTCFPCSEAMLFYLFFATLAVCNLVFQAQSRIEHILPPRYTQASMFIYLGHSLLLLSGVAWMLNRLLPMSGEGWTLVRYFLIPPITVAILLFLFSFLRNRFPHILYMLLGRKY